MTQQYLIAASISPTYIQPHGSYTSNITHFLSATVHCRTVLEHRNTGTWDTIIKAGREIICCCLSLAVWGVLVMHKPCPDTISALHSPRSPAPARVPQFQHQYCDEYTNFLRVGLPAFSLLKACLLAFSLCKMKSNETPL